MKITANEKVLLVAGLLMPALIMIIKHYFKFSDSAYGFAVGLGIGLEIVALVRLVKRKKALQQEMYP